MKPLSLKVRELAYANVEKRFAPFLNTYKMEIPKGAKKAKKGIDTDVEFELMDEVFANQYLNLKLAHATDPDEIELLEKIVESKNEEQEYGDYAHIDDNEHIFVKESVNRLNFASSADMSMSMRYTYVANTVSTILMQNGNKADILDIGCSKGTFYHFWRNLFQPAVKPTITYTGVDIREKVINYCKENLENKEKGIEFFLANIMEDELPGNKKYDCILLMEIIEHIPVEDGKKVLKKCKELLKENGVLVVSSPNPKKEVGQMLTNPAAHVFEYSLQEMKDLLAENEFQIVDTAGWFGRAKYLKLGLTPAEKDLYTKLTRLGSGMRMAIMSFLRPDLAECYTMICRHGTEPHLEENFKPILFKK
jgi:2-polyprenyl-3-methyl-5-hydroxy-6-metoxy-1,4-benzoquinol methylase